MRDAHGLVSLSDTEYSTPAEAAEAALADGAGGAAALLFFGYLGSSMAVQQMHGITRETAGLTASVREGVDPKTGAKFDLLWGAYAYRMTPDAAAAILGTPLYMQGDSYIYSSYMSRNACCIYTGIPVQRLSLQMV
jgi:hypothetical protein